MDLNSVKLFVEVISKGSFSAAAKFSNTPVATVSRRVAELEKNLNIKLIERSTRSLRPTEAGMLLFQFAQRGVSEFEAGLMALADQQIELEGTLRISIPPSYEPIWKLIQNFQSSYSNINVEVFASERRINFIEDGIDLALRVGPVDSLSAIARPLLKYKHVLLASKKYLEKYNEPKKPSELTEHKCAMWGTKNSLNQWTLGKRKIKVQPRFKANDYALILKLIESGEYISELPPFLAKSGLKSGSLVEVLSGFPFEELEVNLVYPSKENISRITKTFIDYCIENRSKLV